MVGKLRNDLTGRKFGFITVIRRSSNKGNGKKSVVKWECKCKCGKEFSVKSDSLISGHTLSCGCKKRVHGKSNKERLYQTWKNMRQRCNNPKRKDYPRYGGRGISICPEWNDYKSFRSGLYLTVTLTIYQSIESTLMETMSPRIVDGQTLQFKRITLDVTE